MKINFAPRGVVQIDDARLVNKFRNFAGAPTEFNHEGDRNFAIIIPNQEIADILVDDKNEFGVGWNVKIKAPREEGDEPFRFLSVKVKFNAYGPNVYLHSGNRVAKLGEDQIAMLDDIEIDHCDIDIRPYDGEGRFGPFRSAYLQAIRVYQRLDRFAAEYAVQD